MIWRKYVRLDVNFQKLMRFSLQTIIHWMIMILYFLIRLQYGIAHHSVKKLNFAKSCVKAILDTRHGIVTFPKRQKGVK